MVKGGYSVEVSDKYGKKVILEIVDYHVVEKGLQHEELGQQGFDFNLFDEEMEECVGNDVKELTYFLIIMKLWPGDWEEQLDRMNKKVDEDNERGDSIEWKTLEALAVFKGLILEEHWVSSISTYLWTWGVETVGEGSKDKREEEEEVFD